jgi:hypothetical protein
MKEELLSASRNGVPGMMEGSGKGPFPRQMR